jgi:AcrR family transcriptional regulator
LSSRIRKPLQPQREVGRQRVAELMEAAAAVIQERGFEAATMAEIAERADAKIGSLYRFFPNKDAVAEALMQHYGEFLEAEYDRVSAQAKDASPEVVADLLMDLLVKLFPQTKAMTALLESRTDWTKVRFWFRRRALAGVKRVLIACAPALDDKKADDVAVVVFNNMRTMVGMTMKDAPTSPGAPQELRLMNRLYLADRLGRDGQK